MEFLLAQSGSGGAINIIQNANTITQANAASWQSLWNDAISPSSDLWKAIISLSQILLGLSFLYMAYKNSADFFSGYDYQLSKIIEFITPTLLVGILLANDGFFFVNLIQITRTVAYHQVELFYNANINGIQMKSAVEALEQTTRANMDARQLFRDCVDKSGQDLTDCLNEQAKSTGLQQIVQNNNNSLNGNFAQSMCGLVPGCNLISSVVDGVANGWNPSQIMADMFASPFIAIAQSILTALQWAVSNGIELALLLTALFGPLAAALTIMPVAGRMFWSWASGFAALLSFHFGYAILTGLMAITIYSMQSSSGNASGLAGIPELLSDIGFLLFTAVVSPLIAGSIATFGGISLFSGFSKAASDGLRAVTSVFTSVVGFGIK
ncbi:MAG: hypothetical protein WBM86_31385 [Waterburya sp.]